MMKNTLRQNDSDKVKNFEDYQAAEPLQLELFGLCSEDQEKHPPAMMGKR